MYNEILVKTVRKKYELDRRVKCGVEVRYNQSMAGDRGNSHI